MRKIPKYIDIILHREFWYGQEHMKLNTLDTKIWHRVEFKSQFYICGKLDVHLTVPT